MIADVDVLDLKREYERLMREDPTFAEQHVGDFEQEAEGSTQSVASLLDFLQSGTKAQRRLAVVVCGGVMTLGSGQSDTKGAAKRFEPLIIDFRNRALAKRILRDDREQASSSRAPTSPMQQFFRSDGRWSKAGPDAADPRTDNSLNSVAALIGMAPDRALEATEQLADLFRFVVQVAQELVSRLQDELSLCERYLEIERLRFESVDVQNQRQ